MTLATLPMYDWPEVRTFTDRLWNDIAELLTEEGFDCPTALERTQEIPQIWESGHCLFSQTCGWPYITRYRNSLTVLLTPHYGIEGCEGAFNSSRIVCRQNDDRQKLEQFGQSTAVINAIDSQSGHQALKSSLASQSISAPFFKNCLISGSHLQSIKMVANETADICAIDPVSWQLARQFDAEHTNSLRVLTEGPYTPGLPFVCSNRFADEMAEKNISAKLLQLLGSNLDAALQKNLHITGASQLPLTDYENLLLLDQAAQKSGFNDLTTG